MKYRKHLVSTIAIYQLNGYFRRFAGRLTCNSNFHGYNRPRKLKTANIYPHDFEAKTRKFGAAKIFHLRYHAQLKNKFSYLSIKTYAMDTNSDSSLEHPKHVQSDKIRK